MKVKLFVEDNKLKKIGNKAIKYLTSLSLEQNPLAVPEPLKMSIKVANKQQNEIEFMALAINRTLEDVENYSESDFSYGINYLNKLNEDMKKLSDHINSRKKAMIDCECEEEFLLDYAGYTFLKSEANKKDFLTNCLFKTGTNNYKQLYS